MLATSDVVAFAPTADPVAAKRFYGDVLGLKLIEDSPFAIVFDANGITLRVTKVQEVAAAPYTILGWNVDDIARNVRDLSARGVVFERYLQLKQYAAGIWISPDGARIAWFKDPDGNTLSLVQWRRQFT